MQKKQKKKITNLQQFNVDAKPKERKGRRQIEQRNDEGKSNVKKNKKKKLSIFRNAYAGPKERRKW